MASNMAEALAALEKAAERVERLESRIVRQHAEAGKLRQEVEGAIRDLDAVIGSAGHG